MAFNYQPFYSFPPQYQQIQQQQQAQQQIQNGGFVSVRNQKEAWDYPIAPGNSITFIDENAMRCYIKSKGFSPFEQPKFDIYRLVKEEMPKQDENVPLNDKKENETNNIEYVAKDEIEAISKRIDALRDKVKATIERVDSITLKVDNFTLNKQPQKTKKEDDLK